MSQSAGCTATTRSSWLTFVGGCPLNGNRHFPSTAATLTVLVFISLEDDNVPDSITSTPDSPPLAVTRQELYDLAWSEPMLRVAERFGVSSSYLSRVFTELRVPRPAPGYWAKREFGKSPPTPALPPARPGGLTEWKPGMAVGTSVRTLAKAVRAAKANLTETIRPDVQGAAIEKSRGRRVAAASGPHELLVGVKPHFLKTRRTENQILRPYKRMLVDVMASQAKLDDILDAAQVLFTAMNQRGLHVGFTPVGDRMSRAKVELLEKASYRNYQHAGWVPERPTVVYVGGTAIGLTLFETTEEVEVVYVKGEYLPVRDLSAQQLKRYTGSLHWRSKMEQASGRLCLQAYCPFWRVDWSKRWKETKPGTFRGMVTTIIGELEAIAPELTKQVEEARLRAEEEQRQWNEAMRQREIEAERLRREMNKQESRRELLAAIASWDEARRIGNYFDSIEAEVQRLPVEEAAVVRERLRLGRELVGVLDPLTLLKTWKSPGER